MNFKGIIYYISAICFLFVFSCTTRDDSFTPPEGSTGVAFIVTSIIEANNDRELITREGFEIEFLDTSIGTSDKREWVLPPNSELVSGTLRDQKIKAKFTSGGKEADTLTIKLNKGSSSDPLEASVEIIVLEGTSATFTATPVDPTAVFSIDPNTNTINVEAGTQVQFNATVKGGLDEFDWKFPGQTPEISSEQNPIVTINKLGESGYNFRARSTSPFGDVKLPFFAEGDEETFYKIIVTPSSKPLVVSGDVMELEDETIQVPINGELVEFSGLESSFTVTVNGMPFTIQSVAVNSENPALIDIKLTDPIYRPDVITVSYAGTSIQSTDTRTLASFTDLPVMTHNVNLLDPVAYDFEDGGLGWGADPVNTSIITYTTERASSGTTSMKVDNTDPANSNFRVLSANTRFNITKTDTYSLSVDVYLEPGNTWNAVWPTITGPGVFQQLWTDVRSVPRGEWTTITRDFDLNEGAVDLYVLFRSEGGGGVAFIDNWRLVNKEERP